MYRALYYGKIETQTYYIYIYIYIYIYSTLCREMNHCSLLFKIGPQTFEGEGVKGLEDLISEGIVFPTDK